VQRTEAPTEAAAETLKPATFGLSLRAHCGYQNSLRVRVARSINFDRGCSFLLASSSAGRARGRPGASYQLLYSAIFDALV